MNKEIERALECAKNKNFKAAKKIYLEIIKNDKSNFAALSLLGLLYFNLKSYTKSEKYLEKAAKVKETQAVNECLGYVKYYLKDYKASCFYLSKALNKNKNFDLYDKTIKAFEALKQYSKAYNLAAECQKLYPLKKEALYNLAYNCINAGRLNDALKYGKQLILKYPKYPESWLHYGLMAEMIYRNYELAIKCFKTALKLGEKEKSYGNLAIAYINSGDYKTALRYINKIKTSCSNRGDLHFLLATIYFKQRKFKKGFKHYALKYLDTDKTDIVNNLKRVWDGKPHKDETVIVYFDQGKGDCIMFARYLPFLEKNFKRIKIFADSGFSELFKRSFREYKRITPPPPSPCNPLPARNTVVLASDLPFKLKMDGGEFPFTEGYLTADFHKIETFRKNYFDTNKIKIGLCWEAGMAEWRDLIYRTVDISIFAPLFELKNVQYYSFQFRPRTDDYKKYTSLIELGSTFKDFDDTAAALMNLDLLITVDTSVAHLAGALGVKTFMLLPTVSDWRWFDCTDKCDWYDSIKIFKQTDPTSWESVVRKIKDFASGLPNG